MEPNKEYAYSPNLNLGDQFSWVLETYTNFGGPIQGEDISEGDKLQISIDQDLDTLVIPNIADEVIINFFSVYINGISAKHQNQINLASFFIMPSQVHILPPPTGLGLNQV